MKKSTILTVILLIYLAVMAYLGLPMFYEGKYLEYFGIIIITLIIIFALRWVLRKKEAMRLDRRKRQDASDRRNFRDDQIL